MRRVLLLAAMALVLAGCAGVERVRGTMHFGGGDAPEGERLLWPQPPEVPRYLYVGTLTGERNFRRDAEGTDALRRLGRWLVGLDGGEAPVVLQRPACIVGDARGRIFVGDTSRQAVFVFDAAGGELQVWEQASPLLRFVAPAGLAVGDDGGLFVADAELGAVVRLDATGRPLGLIGRGLLQRPTGLARDPDTGDLYVADTSAHDLKVFAADGTLRRRIGRRGTAPGEFNFPAHLAFARGMLYVTDTMNSRVQVIPVRGDAPPRTIGARGPYVGNLVRPKGVSVDGEGNVYVVESYHDHLLVFSPAGELLLPIGGTGTATGRFVLPAGVWIDGSNRVFVADMFNGRVVAFQFLGGG